MLGSMLLQVHSPIEPHLNRLIIQKEFIQHEDRFTDVREALKLLNKMDFDKLIVSVRSSEPIAIK